MIVNDTHEQYLSKEGYCSNSRIKLALESDYNYKWFKNANRPPTDSQILGTAIHIAILEHDRLHDSVISFSPEDLPAADKNGKRTFALNENKEWYAKFEADNVGKIILSKEEWDIVCNVGESAHEKRYGIPEMGGLIHLDDILATGVNEQSIYIDDPKHFGLPMKCRPDHMNPYIFIDVKSTKSAKPSFFHRDVYKYGYVTQIPLYSDIIKVTDGLERKGYILAFETKPPFHVQLFKLGDDMEEYGRFQYRYGIEKIKRIEAEGASMGYETDKYKTHGSAIILPELRFMQDVDYGD
jgi:hypothetical protein